MATNYDFDELNRHFLFLERLASGGINSVVTPSLEATYEAVAAILNGYDGIRTKAEYNAIVRAISEAVNTNAGWVTLTQENLQELAEYETQWQASMQAAAIGQELTQPTAAQLLSFINNAALILESGSRVDSGLWADFTKANTQARADQINSIVQRGFIRGQTIAQMKRDIKQVTEGLLSREAEALARTGYVHYAAQAQEAVVQRNKALLDEYYYVVTFDNRTSDRCIGVSKLNEKGKRLKVGDPKAPMPPLHFNCRTRRLAVPKDFEFTGTKQAVGGKKGADAEEAFIKRENRLRKASQVRYKGKKDSDIFKPGQVDGNLTYSEWLRNQPRWFISDVLGPARAKLWLDDGVSLNKFSDLLGNPLTLAQIREREGL